MARLAHATALSAPPAAVVRSSVALVLAAATIALIFVVAFVVPQPLWSAQPGGPPGADPAPISGLGWPGALLAVAFSLAWSLPFRPYVLALGVLERSRAHMRLVVLLTGVLAVVTLLIYPAFGSDVFMYIAYARQWWAYGENPLLAMPALHPADWSYAFAWARTQPSPYGPLWALITWPIAMLGGDSARALVLAYKALALGAYGACCWLLWSSAPASRRAYALMYFAWSPLVLFETLGKVHNDILLALAALAAVRFDGVRGMVALALGGLIKLSGLAVLPALAAHLIRARRRRALIVGLAVAALTVIGFYAPFWRGPATLAPVFIQTNRVVWSPGSLLIASGVDPSVTRIALAVAWASACTAITMKVREIAASAALTLLATLLLLTTAFFAHYLVPVITLAALSHSRLLRSSVIALSLGALIAYATELLAPALPPGWLGSPSYQAVGSLVTLAPAALVLAVARRDAPTVAAAGSG